ncbi:hypothetical protein TYRP_023423 [Tyrophagus putrescentiae]|nr:hypothetical protein TYRP_023423 [Tyrophagus putrescentiae]
MADKSEEVAHFQEEHSEQGIADATEQVNVDLPNDCHSPPPAYSAAEVKVKVNDNEGGENDVNGGDGGDSGHQALVTKPPITSTSAFYIKKWILLTMISLTILLLLLTIFLAELILPAIDAESCQTNTEDCSMETDKDNKDFRLAARTFLFLLLKLHVFFLWGVARHRLCPSTTYTVLNVLVSFGLGFACVAMPTTSMFRNALVAAALTAVAYSYTKDLRKNMRDSCTTVVLSRLDAVNVNVSEGENGVCRQAVLQP